MTALLSVESVRMTFGGFDALRRVDLSVTEGTIHGLAGANGSGKSTLLNVITGLYQPTSGVVLLRGRNLSSLAVHELAAAGIARMFQTPVLFSDLSVVENVVLGMHSSLGTGALRQLFGLQALARRMQRARADAEELLEVVGVDPAHWGEPAGSLPISLQRRIELARALAVRPTLLLLDEPAAGLSVREVTELGELLCGANDAGLTILVVEHNVGFIREIANRVTILDHGEVIANGPPTVFHDARVLQVYGGRRDQGAASTELPRRQ